MLVEATRHVKKELLMWVSTREAGWMVRRGRGKTGVTRRVRQWAPALHRRDFSKRAPRGHDERKVAGCEKNELLTNGGLVDRLAERSATVS